jgi:hypothetical protein
MCLKLSSGGGASAALVLLVTMFRVFGRERLSRSESETWVVAVGPVVRLCCCLGLRLPGCSVT